MRAASLPNTKGKGRSFLERADRRMLKRKMVGEIGRALKLSKVLDKYKSPESP